MQICYLVPSLKKSGPLEVVYSLIKNIKKSAEIKLISIKVDENEDIRFKELDIDIIYLNAYSKLESIKIIKKIKENHIVHSHGLFPDMLNVLSGRKKSMSTLHAYPISDYSMKYGYKGYVYALTHFVVFSMIQQKFACSELLASKLKPLNVKGINNGVISEIFKPVSNDLKNKLKVKYNIPQEKIILYFIGSLINRKNIKDVIEAFLKLNDEKYVLIIAGDGLHREFVTKISKSNNSITYLGKIKTPEEIHQIGDILLAPSKSEGFGLMVAEALSCGSKAVISNIEIFRTIYSKDHLVTFIQPNNVKCLIEGIIKAKNNNREKDKNIKYCSSHMSRKYLENYKLYLDK